jgi:hypothetical protein
MKNLIVASCFALSLAQVGACSRSTQPGGFADEARAAKNLVNSLTAELADKVAQDDFVTDAEVKALFDHAQISLAGLDNVEIKGLSIESVSRTDGRLKSDWKEFRGVEDQKSVDEVFSQMPSNLVREGRSAIRAQITATYSVSGRGEDISEAIIMLPRKVLFVERRIGD